MKFTGMVLLAITSVASAQNVHWEFSENTNGNNVYWTSSTSVDPSADQYEFTYEITYVGVDIVFLGQIIGPEDVTSQIDPEFLFGTGLVNGPTPIVMMDEALEADADGDTEIDVAANIFMQINGKGFGQFNVTEVFLGDVMVDTGWPFGWQNVDIDRIYMNGYMDITPIIIECPEDTNGDGNVNVSDILAAIGNWGGSGDGDVDGSGIVDVSDLLAIVGAWGPC
ncbi:MAG: hypothetical protein HOC27_03255 [Phycisphaerae bacterium]|jgi:hypothetical protein|nr:hypothetical protein [Phycisphaerae bacterium]